MSMSVYQRLGIRPVINGMGTYTILGGSLMPPEVLQAMSEAARHFVAMDELQAKVGARIAELIGVPAALVTAGAASAITVATAACMTLGDDQALQALPDANGLRNEVILQRSHQSGYEAQILLTGARLVWVETRAELDRAINERTAMLFFLNRQEPVGQIKREEWIKVGKERGIPTFNDAAADVPPVDRLSIPRRLRAFGVAKRAVLNQGGEVAADGACRPLDPLPRQPFEDARRGERLLGLFQHLEDVEDNGAQRRAPFGGRRLVVAVLAHQGQDEYDLVLEAE